jgi:predicted hotdog family 3-hydroxylacyl-ACP dehydratase
MQLDQKEIEKLIPHSGTMSLLSRVLKWDKDHIICLTNTHRCEHNPLRNRNTLSSICGVEYAAQAMAVHGALSSCSSVESSRLGFIASIKDLNLLVTSLDNIETDLEIEAKLLMSDSKFMIYQFSIRSEGIRLLFGRISIYFKKELLN